MSKLFKLLNEVRKDEEGATMVEYAILVGLISVVAIVVITAVGSNVKGIFSTACGSLSTAGGGTAC